jgi:hypothetical protein
MIEDRPKLHDFLSRLGKEYTGETILPTSAMVIVPTKKPANGLRRIVANLGMENLCTVLDFR